MSGDQTRISPFAALRRLCAAALLCLPLFTAPAHAQDFTTGLSTHWKFDEGSGTTLLDSNGSSHLTAYGGISWSSSDKVKGLALRLNGTNAYALQNITSGAWSIHSTAFWFKAKNGGTMYHKGTGNNCAYNPIIRPASASEGGCGGVNSVSYPQSYIDNKWHHIVVTRDNLNFKIYIDGKLSASKNPLDNGHAQTATSAQRVIGATHNNVSPHSYSGFYSGLLDEMRTYSRALTAEDVKALYEYERFFIGPIACDANHKAVIIYNHAQSVMQYCDGASWIPIGKTASIQTNTMSSAGLIGHWTLNETSGATVRDSSTTGATGTWTDGANNNLSEESVSGAIDTALHFNESSAIDLGNPGGIYNFGTSTDFTASAWIKSTTAGNDDIIFSKYASGATPGFALQIQNNHARAFIRDGSGSGVNEIVTVEGSTNVLDGNWHHIVASYDRDNVLSLYVDGVSNVTPANITTVTGSINNSTPLYIGRRGTSYDYFNGDIDDVRIYNRALSAADAQTLYVSRPPAEMASQTGALSSGLVGYWRLDESAGSTTTADSAGSNPGTLLNMDPATDWGTGQSGGSLDFDGTDDIVDLGNAASGSALDVRFPMTISAWVNPTQGNGSILARREGNNVQWQLTLYEVSGNAQLRFYGPTAGSINGPYVPMNTWTHVAATAQSNGSIQFYINGVASSSTPGTLSNTFYAAPVAIGGRWSGYPVSNFNFRGKLDDIRLYNRAVSADEISQIYRGMGCYAPSGTPGKIIFNSTEGVMQYCNGGGWIAMGPKAGLKAPTQNLLAHYAFDETGATTTAADSKNGYNATLTAFSSPSASRITGVSGNGLQLTTNEYVVAPGTVPLTSAEGTMSAWVKPNAAANQFVIYGSPVSGGDGFGGENEIHLGLTAAGTAQLFIQKSGDTLVEGGTVPANTWHHIAATWKDGDVRAVYVDGVNVSSEPYTMSSNYTLTNLRFGRPMSSTRAYNGGIDNVRLYNRALTDAEIAQMYEADENTSTEVAQNGLVHHWKLDTGSGTTAIDSRGSASGTLVNTPTWGTGKRGNALTFNGTSQFIYTASNATDYQKGTLAAWVKPTATPSGSETIVMASNTPNRIYLLNNMGEFALRLGSGANTSTGETLPLNAWSHVALIWNAGTYAAYLNGVEVSTGFYSGLSGINNCPVIAGYHDTCNASGSVGGLYKGGIDDVRIYNRALNLNEVQTLAGRGTACSNPDGPAGEIVFNDDEDLMQYCNGRQWVAMSEGPNTGGAGGTPPAGANRWYAVGTDGEIYSSADGTTWSLLQDTGSQTWQDIAYDGAGRWVLVGNGGEIWTSTDGATFSLAQDTGSQTWYSVAYNGSGRWIVVGTGGEIYTSTNGTTWTLAQDTGSQTWYSVTYNPNAGRWMVGGSGGALYSSTNGTSWSSWDSGGSAVRSIIYDNLRWMTFSAPSNVSYYYDDPSNSGFLLATMASANWKSSVYTASGGLAVADGGLIWGGTSNGTWSLVQDTGSQAWQDIAYDGSGRWMVVGDGGEIWTSTNSTSWSLAQNTGSQTWNAVAYGVIP